jgi:hypothetical protein
MVESMAARNSSASPMSLMATWGAMVWEVTRTPIRIDVGLCTFETVIDVVRG